MVLLSIKSRRDSARNYIWPEKFDFSHYTYVLNANPDFANNLCNSVYVTIGTMIVTTVCAVLAGYALVHLRMPGRRIVLIALRGLDVLPDPRHRADLDLANPAQPGTL